MLWKIKYHKIEPLYSEKEVCSSIFACSTSRKLALISDENIGDDQS